ncbi:non-ribosomal peptide synthetase [Coniochaeta sp. PMI_546]|nr:non-ribosomal peptide synthetase [Coniochaeta sp. PMI_546]
MTAAPDSEAAASLAILNHPPTRLPGPNYLHDLVRHVGNTKNAAIEYLSVDGDRLSISYKDLHTLSDNLAHRLSALTQKPPNNDQFVVPILAPQHPSLYVAILAILKAGGAFCPLNLDAPLERVKFILKDVAATVIITTSKYASAIPPDDSLVVLLLDEEPCQAVSTQFRPRKPKMTDLAYVMYTSGSTGTPKGVGVSHEAATQSLLAHDRHIPQFSRFLQFAAPTFDVSVFEIFFPLFRGSTLIGCDRARMLDDLPSVICTMHVDACELTPSVAGSLLRKRENAPCLKLLLTIGEMLTKPVVHEFGGGEGQPSMLWAMYGPTEAAIHCTLQPALAKDASVGNIGIPLDTVSAFILHIPEDSNADKTPRVLAVGEVGELAVGGYQLASGYINRPETTSSAFIDSPYGPLYRTLDKARMLPDGTIECLGRIGGGQVKLRGQRIELGEIEQVALRTPGCHGAIAAVIGGILVLFCAVDDLDNMSIEIRNTCEAWLPTFMVPGDIVISTDFPILPSGKVNRRQLISDYSSRQEVRPQLVAGFKDAKEQTLCQLATKILGRDIQPSTNLVAAGMDSLVTIKFTSALRQAGFKLSALDVLNARTISQLHRLIAHGRDNVPSHPRSEAKGGILSKDISIDSIPILQTVLGDVEDMIPCTPLQSAMLAETICNPQAYCNWLEWSVTGKYDSTTIRSWMQEIISRNTILRTGFVLHGRKFTQVIWRDASTVPISIEERLFRDFSLSTEEDFLHPFRVQICADEDQSRILLQIHHSLYDGWTSDLFLADLNALSRGNQLESRPQFSEVADYCQSTTFFEQCDCARKFWAESLASFQPNPFPILLDVPPNQSQVQSRVASLALKPQSVRRTLQEIECSPQVLFQAALAWLWSSLVGDEDIVTGFVTSGRTVHVAGIEQVMGPCIATLPLRTNLSQTRTIRDLLGSIQAWNRSALSHTSLPLGEIKKAAGTAPGQSLYDVLFVYQESLYSTRTDGDRIREIAHLDYLETKLLLEVEPREGHYECRLTYHTDAISEAHIAVLFSELHIVAQHMLENINSDLLSTRTVFPEQVLSTYNLEPQSFTGTPDLASAVENVVSRTPDKTALCFASRIVERSVDAEYVTYHEFNSMANKIARHVRASGCSIGDVVSVIMEKSVLLYAGILGIVKAGCSYLPLLPSTPIARIDVISAQANVKLCLTDNSAAAKLSQIQGRQFQVVNLEQADLRLTEDTNLNIPVDSGRIAVIVYTSGSTGVPKGVCVTQLNVTSNIDALSKIYPVKEDSRLLQSCSQAFDVSVFEMFFTWTQGMTLCSATNDTLFEDLERAIRALGVTHLSMTPTVAALIDPKNVPMVEFLVTSGEPMTDRVARSWWRQLYQGYGPSETTNICTVKKMGPNDVIQHLGYSFENTSTVVLFQDGVEAVPRGCLGELCFGGDQVAQGYLNMPELTAAKFIDHPKFGRLYRSGDIGRMLPDGSLVITGRVDDQIKLRGQRIELREINATILQSNIVSGCHTLLVNRQSPSAVQLVSFYVPQESADIAISKVMPLDERMKETTASIFRLLTSKLPNYMVPSYLVPISKLPMTASGKLDRAWFMETFQKLEHSYLELTASNIQMDQGDGEWNNTERELAEIVSSVLPTGGLTVSKWTPLVSFGLDSISAIVLSRQLQKRFKRRIPISLILQNSCVAGLAQALEDLDLGFKDDKGSISLNIFSKEWVDNVKSKCQSQGKVVENILPCTPLQEAMLAASANGKSYLNNMLFRLHADPTAMQGYWATICERQSILRTCFAATEMPHHAFAQVILRGWQPRWLHFDESQGNLDHCVTQHLASHADIVDSWEPPVSFAIISRREQLYLSFVCHHALYDGIAIELLLHEVEQLANGIALETPPAVEPFLKTMLADSPTSEDFWKEQLLDFKPVELPRSSIPTTAKTSKTHDIHTADIHITLRDITERTKNLGCSLLSVCQAAWALVLTIILDVEDVCFGNVVSCRSVDVDGVEKLVAPCFNTVPIRANLADIRQNIDLIKALHALNPQVIQHQFTSLRRIQSLVFPGEVNRVFDTLLILQQPARSLDHKIWSLERDDGEMDIPLVCEFRPDTQHDVLSVQLHYDSHFSTPFTDFISDLLQHCIIACLKYPSSRIPTHSSLPPTLTIRLSELDLQRNPSAIQGAVTEHDGDDWSDVESRIRTVLAKLSSVPERRIRRTTTIYQLGLDSIHAVQIASILRKQGLHISASDVVEQKTCASLATKVLNHKAGLAPTYQYDFSDYRRRAQSQLGQRGISKDSVDTVLPCTSLQMGMITQFIQSKGHDYFNYIDFQLHDDIDLHAITKAWTKISDSHAMLRTGFIPVDDADFPFAMVQYSTSTVGEIIALVSNKTASPWDLDNWRLAVAKEVLNDLHNAPWRVALVDHDGHKMMHLAIHHALYDAQSLQRMLEDLAQTLQRKPLAPAPRTEEVVKDIITQGSSATKQEVFWKEQSDHVVINHFPVLTPLRVDSKRMSVESIVSSQNFSEIQQSLGASGFTVQAALQAAWTRILSSYLGESSVSFGVVLSGRNSEATQDAVFPCISTLPVISTNKSFNRELLQAMLNYTSQIYQNQHVPLTKIQRWLGYPEGQVFDTLLVYQKLARSADTVLPWTIVNDQGTVDYPVSVEVEPTSGDKLVYTMTFSSDIVPMEHANLLLEQFDAVFCDLALRPDGYEDGLYSRIPRLFSCTPSEEPEIYCDEDFLHQFVESQALKTPEKTALEFVTGFRGSQPISKTWSYRLLDDNGNRMARMLQPYVRTGATVAVHFDKCPEVFFSILGVLKAGCAFVALDPGSPPSRKQFILEDSRASVLLTSSDLEESLGISTDIPLIVVDEASLSKLDSNPVMLKPELSPQHTCYCLYTSGTTGTPKGCEITHENAVQAMLAFQRLFAGHWDETSKWLQFASFHFDVAVLEQYWSWSVGITLTAAPRDLILEDLAGTISKLEITHIDLTPSLARLIHPDEVPSLTRGVFITGGEQLKQEILDAWGSKSVIYNAYGPTEATIGVTTYPRVPQNGRPSNIGKQFVNVGTYVLKQGTETPVLRGGVGELCVSGKLVGKGYLSRDDLTAERFPTLKEFNERVYRTGDLVRILHDGCFDFLGRADDQVKLRGQRLELGEINHAIRSGVSAVTDVATLVVRNERQRKDILVSFVATGKNSSRAQNLRVLSGPEASDLSQRVQAACRDRLPRYMVPTYVIVLPFIPLSSNNKAETRTLKKLFVEMDHSQLVSLMKPVSNTTIGSDVVGREVLRVLRAVATVPMQEVDSGTTIFDFGIDSISVMRFSSALKRAGFSHTSPSLILTHPRLDDLVSQLSQKRTASGKNHALAAKQLVQACHHKYRALVETELGIDAASIEYIAPCSPLQEGMISRSNMPVAVGAYFNTFKYKLSSQVSSLQLRKAWMKLVESCSVLRTRFVRTTDGYVQVATKATDIPWTELCLASESDLEGLVTEKQRYWIERNAVHVKQPLDIMIITVGESKYMIVNVSHGIYDAISLDIMLDRLREFYLDIPISTPAPSYLEALVHGPLRSYAESQNFWVEHLKSTLYQSLPVLCAQPSSESISCDRLISAGDLESLRTGLGVTHQAIIQAVWISVLQQFLVDVTVGVVISGRSIDLEGADGVIGPLFNTVAFHPSLAPGETWASLVKQCHNFNVSIIPFQHIALRDVQKWCSGGKPLFDTLFSFQMAAEKPAGVELWTLQESPPNPDFALAFEAALTSDNHLRLQLVAKAGFADMNTLSSLLDQVEAALQSAHTPELSISLASHHESRVTQNGAESHEVTMQGRDSFEWTDAASAIRDEVAFLADVPAESVTATTSLLELGLDSIDLIKLSSRLRGRGIIIASAQLMRDQVISAMIRHLHQGDLSTGGTSNGARSIQSVSEALKKHLLSACFDLHEAEDVLPVTPLQDSMIAEMLQSDFHRYFNHDVLMLDTTIDTDRLLQAWQQVVANSPILRSTFVEIDSPDFDAAYCQVVSKSLPLVLRHATVRDRSEFSQVMESARQRASREFGKSHLLQLTLVNVDKSRYLVLSIAHALYDGWSLALLHQDVQAAYYGSYLPRSHYKEYLTRIITASTSEAKQFWSSFLAGAHATLVPQRTLLDMGEEEEVFRFETPSSIPNARVREFCRRYAVSLQVLGQACWAAVLASHTKSLDVTFGVVLSGRDTEEAEELLFPMMNTVAVRSILHGSIVSWLRYMQENMTNISSFQHYPLRAALKLAGTRRGPLFNTLFIQQRAQESIFDEELPWMASVGGDAAVEYPICVEIESSGEQLTWRAACNSAYMPQKETAKLIRHLDVVLQHVLDSPAVDVLAFEGGGVSICGLPSFELSDGASHATDTAVSDGIEDTSTWSATESLIRSAFSEVSGVPMSSISKKHTIYNLGLDSISTIKVSSLLRKKDITLSVRQILGAASLQEMAIIATAKTALNGAERNGDSTNGTAKSDGVAVDRENSIIACLHSIDAAAVLAEAGIDESLVEEVLPATAMQVHMLSVWQNTSGAVFFPEFAYSFQGSVGIDAIRSSWVALVEHHPILRTFFVATASRRLPFLQVIQRYRPELPSIIIEQGSLASDIRGVAFGPLVSFQAICVGDDHWRLKLKIHHSLYDGISLPAMIENFQQLCQGYRLQNPDQNHSIWKKWLSLQVSERVQLSRRTFWTEYLEGVKTSPFQARTTSSSSVNTRTSVFERAAFKDTAKLQAVCAASGVSLQALFFAAYAKFFAQSAGCQDDIVFGMYLANRTSMDGLDQLPYPTLSLVPLRVRDLSRDVVTVAKSVQADLYEISSPANASVGLWEIFSWTGLRIDSFVNFLSLPDSHRTDGRDGLSLTEASDNDVEVQSQISSGLTSEDQRLLASNLVRDAYAVGSSP